MSTEHQPTSHSPERRHNELEGQARERLETLRSQAESEAETDHPERRAEAAREAIRHHTQPEQAAPTTERSHGAVHTVRHHLNQHVNFAGTMKTLQRQLTPVSRAFSRVIHTEVVERTSEQLEKTVARPSVMFGATWTALVVGAAFYFTARTYGYALSGSELLLAFIVGGVLGIIGEGLLRHARRN